MIRLQWATKVFETLLGKDAFRYLSICSNLFASSVKSVIPRPSIQCCVGAVVCAVEEIEIEISTLFRGKERKCVQDTRNSSFIPKCLNTFDAYCSSKFIVTSVVLHISDRSLFMAWWGGESFFGGTFAHPYTPFSPEKIKTPALFKIFFPLEIVLGTCI